MQSVEINAGPSYLDLLVRASAHRDHRDRRIVIAKIGPS